MNSPKSEITHQSFENPIFTFLYPDENNSLKELSIQDLKQLLLLLNNYLLEYRPYLGIPNNNSFGIEIELEKKLPYLFTTNNKITVMLSQYLQKQVHEWICDIDLSLNKNGIEIDSPVLYDTQTCWQDIYRCCMLLSNIGYIDEKCGGHIHVGAHLFSNDPYKWLRFFKLWAVYENIIFRFTNGSYLNTRKGINKYAEPISIKTWEEIRRIYYNNPIFFQDELFAMLKEYRKDKYQAVNLQHVNFIGRERYGNTIEFRCPNGTLDPIIWQNNINLMLSIINACLSDDKIDEDMLFKRWIYLYQATPNNQINYNEIYLEQALEFCDLIFNNNLDKIYFLKQYLKNYSIAIGKHFTKAPTLTTNYLQKSRLKSRQK